MAPVKIILQGFLENDAVMLIYTDEYAYRKLDARPIIFPPNVLAEFLKEVSQLQKKNNAKMELVIDLPNGDLLTKYWKYAN